MTRESWILESRPATLVASDTGQFESSSKIRWENGRKKYLKNYKPWWTNCFTWQFETPNKNRDHYIMRRILAAVTGLSVVEMNSCVYWLDQLVIIICKNHGRADWNDLKKYLLVKHASNLPLLVGGWATPLKNTSSSIGMIRNPILMGK